MVTPEQILITAGVVTIGLLLLARGLWLRARSSGRPAQRDPGSGGETSTFSPGRRDTDADGDSDGDGGGDGGD